MNVIVWQCDKCGYMQNRDAAECRAMDIFILKHDEYGVNYSLYICKWCFFSAFKSFSHSDKAAPVHRENPIFSKLRFTKKR